MLKNDEILKHEFAENNIYWRLYREVLPGYYEGTIQIYYTEPYSDWRHKLFPIRVNVLVKDSTIFYWIRKSQDSNAHYTQVYDSFVIDNEYKNFVTQFKSTYKSELNRKYLFIDTINFGNQCKPDAELTTEFKLMNKYVADKNIKALTNWLKSGNTELQLFAVKALKFLKNNNENISKELMDLTELVLSKKGNINLCQDGLERRIQIPKLVKDFEAY